MPAFYLALPYQDYYSFVSSGQIPRNQEWGGPDLPRGPDSEARHALSIDVLKEMIDGTRSNHKGLDVIVSAEGEVPRDFAPQLDHTPVIYRNPHPIPCRELEVIYDPKNVTGQRPPSDSP